MVILAQVIKTDLSSSVVDLWHYRKIGHWKLLTLGIFFREGIQEWESHRTSACRHGSCLCTCSKIKLKIREKEVTDKHKYKFYSTLYIPLLVRYLPGHVLPPPHPPCTEEIWSPKNGAEAQYCTVAIVGHLEWVVLWIRKNFFCWNQIRKMIKISDRTGSGSTSLITSIDVKQIKSSWLDRVRDGEGVTYMWVACSN